MLYKITKNGNEALYSALSRIREIEVGIESQNVALIKANKDIPEYSAYVGSHGQNNIFRVTQYYGFVFVHPKEASKKLWTKDIKTKNGVYRPNRRTKEGRRLFNWLNGLLKSNVSYVLSVLGLEFRPDMQLPIVDVVGDVVLCKLDDGQQPIGAELISEEEYNSIIANK